MAEIERISEAKLSYLSGEKGFSISYLEKDYFLTVLLYLIKDVKGIYFKGGTALNKIVFNHTRLSEDLDFTCTAKVSQVKNQLEKIVKENPGLFAKTRTGNETKKFVRVHVYYKSFFKEDEYINIDLNKHSKIHLKPETKQVKHFYEEIPKFSVIMLNQEELVAEKIRSLFQRNQPGITLMHIK